MGRLQTGAGGGQEVILTDGTRYNLDTSRPVKASPSTGALLLAGTEAGARWYLPLPVAPPSVESATCPFDLDAAYAWETADAMLFRITDAFSLRLTKAPDFQPYELEGNPWADQDWCVNSQGQVTRHMYGRQGLGTA